MNIKKIIPQKIKNLYHFGQAILANFVYGFPAARRRIVSASRGGTAQDIKIIGVTGTNGKTTTVWMIGKILEEAGFKVAVNSTINFQIGPKKWVNQTKFTTLSSFSLQKFIREAVKEKCDYLVLETSSHSLDQCRVWGVPYEVAVITNVTREHLDYHKTMEEYRKAKQKLFKKAKTIVVNLDMENPDEFLKFDNKSKYAYTCHPELVSGSNEITCLPAGRDSGSEAGMTIIKAEDIELGINYSSYKLQTIPPSRDPAKAVANYKLNLPGKFNIENALAATCVGLSQNINPEIIKKALEKIQGIPGRMEYVPNSRDLNIIIDYAVTPDSLEKLYQLIKEINKEGRKIIAVFGACGERDRGKRPIMGESVAHYADYIILTNEDPYGEDPNQIINEVFSGIPLCHSECSEAKSKNPVPTGRQVIRSLDNARDDIFHFTEDVNCWRILSRREAIRKALTLAQAGDFVIVTGKGAEETMAIGEERIPWKEKEVIQEELNKI